MNDSMDLDNSEERIEDKVAKINAVLEATTSSSVDFGASSRCSASRSFTGAPNFAASISGIPSTRIEEYSRIENALALNRLTDLKLQRLEQVLNERLRQCRQKISELQTLDSTNNLGCSDNKRVEKFRYLNCGKPYFKDAKNFPAPDNSDTKLMEKSEMYDFSTVASVPGWTIKDKSEFISSVLKMSKDIRCKEINSKMAEIRRNTSLSSSAKKKELDICRKELNAVSKKPLKELALPVDQEYDWELIANKLNRRHSPLEYRSLWKLFLHPSINKDSWSKTEHALLQQLAQDSYQDWDRIAEELNTNRTGYQCFVYFRTNMSNTFTGTKWSKEEEEYLKRLIEYYREDNYIPWGRVAASMENRTKIQIYNKYKRLLEIRKGRFLPEEDAVILNVVAHYGPDFNKINTFLPSRSIVQLKTRYHILSKNTLSTVWTAAEDRELMLLMANQDSTVNYSSLCKYFPGKDRSNIRARYLTLVKWVKRNPNLDISMAPRRGARRLCHGQAVANINKAVEKLKNRMQSELAARKPKRITKESSEKDIEDAIVALLVTESIKEQDYKEAIGKSNMSKLDDKTSVPTLKLNVTNLRKILLLLKANLSKDQFNTSPFSDTYPELTDPETEVNLVKVKSYSRKEVINTIKFGNAPNIWGGKTLSSTEYVMPPHFATITGCKALINLITSTSLPKLDVNVLKARNALFREQLYILMERFRVLFLWPMLLSNEGPEARYFGYSNRKKTLMFPTVETFSDSDIEEEDKD